ncbi:MAG: S-layer homology domain-containing protein, partial [Lawsonibacter sp.]|nr:S-layer homology domain-containing protein [Lawsonibacter sp.]
SLTVNLDGGSGTTAIGNHMAGDAVSIDAGTKSGYTFSGWTATGGGTFASASSAATTYTMPAGAATITANWTANSSGGGTSASTTTVPVSGGSGAVDLSASVSGSTATVSATNAQLQKITSDTKASTVKIDASGLKVNAVVVPSKLVSAADDASSATGLEVALPIGTVTLDKSALAAVSGKGDVKLSIETVANSSLTDTQRKVLGTQAKTALVVDINVYVNGTRTSTFGDGKISVSVPYTPKSGENADSVTVWFIKDDGTIEPKNGAYNAAPGCVEFTTEHLSQYLIVDFPFTDVAENSWYYGSVAYAYNNGLFAGASDTAFSPDTAMTRQMIWMVLARMDGKTPADMDAARTWAIENRISDGSNPTNSITREQMATILYRYAQDKGYDTTQGGMAIREFADYDSISEYALSALAWTVNAGLMQGSNNNIMPTGSATRAQVATILQRFCQNVAK